MAAKRYDLTFRRVIDAFAANDLLDERPSVLLDIVPKIGLRRVRSDHHDMCDPRQGVADFAEELVLSSNRTAVLAGVGFMLFDSLGLHVFGVEQQHPGSMMVDVYDGAEK